MHWKSSNIFLFQSKKLILLWKLTWWFCTNSFSPKSPPTSKNTAVWSLNFYHKINETQRKQQSERLINNSCTKPPHKKKGKCSRKKNEKLNSATNINRKKQADIGTTFCDILIVYERGIEAIVLFCVTHFCKTITVKWI